MRLLAYVEFYLVRAITKRERVDEKELPSE